MNVSTISVEQVMGSPVIVGALELQIVHVDGPVCNKINEDFGLIQDSDVALFEGHTEVAAS